MNTGDTNAAFQTQVKMKPDLATNGFSALNAFFFAGLSKIAYASEDEARGLLVGNSTERGLGFDRFHWFEVGGGMCVTKAHAFRLTEKSGTSFIPFKQNGRHSSSTHSFRYFPCS